MKLLLYNGGGKKCYFFYQEPFFAYIEEANNLAYKTQSFY